MANGKSNGRIWKEIVAILIAGILSLALGTFWQPINGDDQKLITVLSVEAAEARTNLEQLISRLTDVQAARDVCTTALEEYRLVNGDLREVAALRAAEIQRLSQANLQLQDDKLNLESAVLACSESAEAAIDALEQLRANYSGVRECLREISDFSTYIEATSELSEDNVNTALGCAKDSLGEFIKDRQALVEMSDAFNGEIDRVYTEDVERAELFRLLKSILNAQEAKEQRLINGVNRFNRRDS